MTWPAWGYGKLWATVRRAAVTVSLRRVYALCRAWRLLLPPDRPNRQPAPRGRVTVPATNRRWATDLTTVWRRRDGLVAVTVLVAPDRSAQTAVIDPCWA